MEPAHLVPCGGAAMSATFDQPREGRPFLGQFRILLYWIWRSVLLICFLVLIVSHHVLIHRFGASGLLLIGGLSALISLPIALISFVWNALIPLVTGIRCPLCGEKRLALVACIGD